MNDDSSLSCVACGGGCTRAEKAGGRHRRAVRMVGEASCFVSLARASPRWEGSNGFANQKQNTKLVGFDCGEMPSGIRSFKSCGLKSQEMPEKQSKKDRDARHLWGHTIVLLLF